MFLMHLIFHFLLQVSYKNVYSTESSTKRKFYPPFFTSENYMNKLVQIGLLVNSLILQQKIEGKFALCFLLC